MLDRLSENQEQVERLVDEIGQRAANLFETRQLLCAEAVLVALNQGLKGGLRESQAVALAAPFGNAMGKSGCVCGALSGAVMACGLLLGGETPYRHRHTLRQYAHRLHDQFKSAHGSTCCRVLSRHVRQDARAHFRHCSELTTQAAEMAARLVLEARPELATQADRGFLEKRQSRVSAIFQKIVHFVTG